MCEVSEYLNLVESESCQITFCKRCKSFTLAYKSCCASFTAREMGQFKEVLQNLQECDFHYQLMGEEMALIKNPSVSIGFCLSRRDVRTLQMDISESLTLFDAFHIIYN